MSGSSDGERLINKDLLWAPGTDRLTNGQLEASRTRHENAIRPIPSRTALGYDHLMADADRGALIAEVDRLRAELAATRAFAERCTAEREQYRIWRDEACNELESHHDNALTAAYLLADIANAAIAERDELASHLAAGEVPSPTSLLAGSSSRNERNTIRWSRNS